MRAHAFLCLTLAALCSSTALAQPKDKGEGYEQSGAPLEFGCEVIATANTAKAIQQRGATVRDACFAWGTLLRWKADGGKANVVYAMTSTLTFEAGLATSRGHLVVDANGPNGGAPGLALSDGESDDAAVGKEQLYRQPGARPGVCTTGLVGPGKRYVRPPCRVDADCPLSGTCTTPASDELRRKSCGYVVVQVSAASTRVCWRIDE